MTKYFWPVFMVGLCVGMTVLAWFIPTPEDGGWVTYLAWTLVGAGWAFILASVVYALLERRERKREGVEQE